MIKPANKFNIVSSETKRMRQDTFAYKSKRQSLVSLYSLSNLKNKTKPTSTYAESYMYNPDELLDASETQSVQSVNSVNSTSKYYNVITNICAKKAGVSVSASGSPNINGAYEAKIYSEALSKIQGAFWCQTGGWSNLSGDGSRECMRTALATMVSINSDVTVTPDDTGSGASSVTVNGTTIDRDDRSDYTISDGAKGGFTLYNFNSTTDLINAVNNELLNNRSVVVKSTTAAGDDHWVTVTGTKDGKPAKSFNDFIGVDPWYNGSNNNNPSTGSGTGATRNDYSGVITLSSVSGRTLNSSLRILTYR